MRIVAFNLVTGAGITLWSLTATAQVTTRIETRPVYGATVTIEKGVKRRVQVAPTGQAPAPFLTAATATSATRPVPPAPSCLEPIASTVAMVAAAAAPAASARCLICQVRLTG